MIRQFRRFLRPHISILPVFLLFACVTGQPDNQASQSSASVDKTLTILIDPDSSLSIEDQTIGQTYLLLAREAVNRENWSLALTEYSKVLEASDLPEYYRGIGYLERGLVHQKTGDLAEALEDMVRADLVLEESRTDDFTKRIEVVGRIIKLSRQLNQKPIHVAYWRKKGELLAMRPGVFDQTSNSGDAVHLKSESTFPEKLGILQRSGFAGHDQSGLDVSASYYQPDDGVTPNITFTVYVYPRRGRDLPTIFSETFNLLARSYPEMTLSGPFEVAPDPVTGQGDGLVTTVLPKTGGAYSFSPTGLALFESGAWFVKIRYTYATEAQEIVDRTIQTFLKEFGWPRTGTSS